ncbi:MAG TPA: response regulator transcription factor, partial [Streptosporangiaceae bacterium]|nr:response regulator transcription factor [Streptosporangiaceae bacterium]
MIRVVIADDQELVREGFRMIIEREDDLQVVGQANDGHAAIELARTARPDVLLMDLRMPQMDGLEATRRILATPGPPRILVLTTFDRNDYLYAAMKAGASGFLLKDVRRGQLTEAIRTVATGEALLAPSITRRLIEDFVRLPPPGVGVPGRLKDLTE